MTRKVGFLHLGQTHDDFHDISSALDVYGIKSELINLNDFYKINFDEFSVISVRDCRGYHLSPDFLSKTHNLVHLLNSTVLVNSLEIIQASIDKSNYLRKLETSGVSIVPTNWLDENITSIDDIFNADWRDVVLKPVISSKSWNTYRIQKEKNGFQFIKAHPHKIAPNILDRAKASDLLHEILQSSQFCVQKFIPAIFTQGEISFIFIESKFAYAVQKNVSNDNWIAHEFFGGKNKLYSASQKEINWASDIYKLLHDFYGIFLYARIDGIFDGNKLLLLECELMSPRLFLKEANFINGYVLALLNMSS